VSPLKLKGLGQGSAGAWGGCPADGAFPVNPFLVAPAFLPTNDPQTTNAVGVFDSGSPYTVFSPEHAQLIGIDDVIVGRPERINTLGGGIDLYLFDLEIQLLAAGPRFAAQVGFFPARSPRNI